eukprot:Polyplicarium_translucidae@DN2609_c0_g1_i4.p5
MRPDRLQRGSNASIVPSVRSGFGRWPQLPTPIPAGALTTMATAQEVRQETITDVQSLNMMRNAMRTAISSIGWWNWCQRNCVAYLRNLFEEDAFQDKSISGLDLKILRPHNPEAEMVLSWLEQGAT